MSSLERGGRKKIKLIKINTPSTPAVVLGTSYPTAEKERHYPAGDRSAPETTPQASIDVPLPVREQTVLSYRLSTAVRQVLNGFGRFPAPPQPGAAIQSVDVTVGHTASSLGAREPLSHSPSTCAADGALELRIHTCQAVTDTPPSINPVTGRTLR